jgi:hypothetical protein
VHRADARQLQAQPLSEADIKRRIEAYERSLRAQMTSMREPAESVEFRDSSERFR